MEARNLAIDWQDPGVLMQIVEEIKHPLEAIMETTRSRVGEGDYRDQAIFSNTQQIHRVIRQIARETAEKSVSIRIQENPDIFKIYAENKRIQKVCNHKIDPDKVCDPDKKWLFRLEKEIYETIEQKNSILSDLAYKMAVSERQLYRETTRLAGLTPNTYIRILRLYRAKEMIQGYVQHSVSQLAYAVGYNDSYYFSELFAKQYGMTPKTMIESLN